MTAIFLVERLQTGLSTEVQKSRGVGFRELEQLAAHPLTLVFREHQQFRDGTEKTAVGQEPQAAHEGAAIIGSDILRLM